jgi:cardiolipin synthase
MNIPNTLTVIRLALVPVFLIVFFSGIPNAAMIAFSIFLVAGLTDVLDGYLARKYDAVTKWGSVLDPFADKLMSVTVLLSLTIKQIIPVWVILIIGLKELLMVVGAVILFKGNKFIPAQPYGKIATLIFYAAVITIQLLDKSLGLFLIYMTVFSALFALYKYYMSFRTIHDNLRIPSK